MISTIKNIECKFLANKRLIYEHEEFVKNGISSSELAENSGVRLLRNTSILNSLEVKNLVEKRTDSEYKRKTIVSITNSFK